MCYTVSQPPISSLLPPRKDWMTMGKASLSVSPNPSLPFHSCEILASHRLPLSSVSCIGKLGRIRFRRAIRSKAKLMLSVNHTARCLANPRRQDKGAISIALGGVSQTSLGSGGRPWTSGCCCTPSSAVNLVMASPGFQMDRSCSPHGT